MTIKKLIGGTTTAKIRNKDVTEDFIYIHFYKENLEASVSFYSDDLDLFETFEKPRISQLIMEYKKCTLFV